MAEGNSKDGVTIGKLMIKFVRPAYWVMIEAVRDQGVQVMHAGIVMVVVSFPVYLVIILYRIFRRERL